MAVCEVPGCVSHWAGAMRGFVLCHAHLDEVGVWIRESALSANKLDYVSVSRLVQEHAQPG